MAHIYKEDTILNDALQFLKIQFPIENNICRVSNKQRLNIDYFRNKISYLIKAECNERYQLNNNKIKYIIDKHLSPEDDFN